MKIFLRSTVRFEDPSESADYFLKMNEVFGMEPKQMKTRKMKNENSENVSSFLKTSETVSPTMNRGNHRLGTIVGELRSCKTRGKIATLLPSSFMIFCAMFDL